MKKTMKFSLLLAFISIAASINLVNAQDITKELSAFTKQFEEAYNKKDIKALKEMFTKDAVRTATDGKISNGIDSIAAAYEVTFQNNVSVAIQPGKVVTGNDGSTVTTGTYHVTGSSKSGEKIDIKGSYNNIVIKEGGQWKISKQVLTAL